MTPNELAEYLERLVLNTDKAFSQEMTGVQNSLYSDLAISFKGLELDAAGNIKQSAANRKILLEADRKVYSVFKSDKYIAAVSSYVAAVSNVDSKISAYFESVSSSFKPNRVFLKDLQYDTIQAVEKYILQDGLQAQVLNPLSQILTQNVNSGGSYTGFMDQLKQYVKGDENVEGRAMRYTRTYLSDTLFTYARTYQQAVTKDLKLEFYYYAGGVLDNTRKFCIERSGKYFHRNEIEQWAQLDWSGKKTDTTESSIFQYAGGWNCSHQIVPVSDVVVPKEVIDRAKSAGFV